MPQAQRQINLRLLNGTVKVAIATGNNACWHCCCEYPYPLIGRTGALSGPTAGTRIDCPRCGKSYFVVPQNTNQGRTLDVIEIR